MAKNNRYYDIQSGYRTESFEKEVVKKGKVIIWGDDAMKASAPEMVRRHGTQPFRFSFVYKYKIYGHMRH